MSRRNPLMRLEFDGASRCNPGHAGAAALLVRDTTNDVYWQDARYFPNKTNNQAEYEALILGLQECVRRQVWNLVICGDSELVLRQVQGIYAVNHKRLRPLHREAVRLINSLPRAPTFRWIPRDSNRHADFYANLIIDTTLGIETEFSEIEDDGNYDKYQYDDDSTDTYNYALCM